MLILTPIKLINLILSIIEIILLINILNDTK